jgi:formylglycine-generating enzyme required for sulfatase activity
MGLVRRGLAAAFAGAVGAALFLHAPAQAAAEKRVALVVGNSAYQHISRLANPSNDARLMADTLRGLGFTLIGEGPQLDLDEAAFRRAVQSFGNALTGADVALFYYAGHGVQVRGANYLVPVGANPVKEADVDFQMLDTNLVLRQMESAGARLNLVILDACRNNPFGGRGLRSAGSGLAQMQAPQGTLISFATQPGNVALDGAGANSPYTKALTEAIRKPGLDIFRTFNEVGLAVASATNGSQQPWVSLSPIKGDFYFAGLPAGTQPPPPAPPPALAADDVFWLAIRDSKLAALFEEFLSKFPNSPRASEARARLEELKKVAVVVPPVVPPAPPSVVKPAVGIYPQAAAGLQPLPAERERALKPKDTFKECDDCPEMVLVPAGAFTMGSPAGEAERFTNEGPQHRVSFARPFAAAKYAVTFDEWEACLRDGGCNGYRPDDEGWGRGNRPAINLNFDDAKAYVAWLLKKTGKGYRLLSEAEHEYVTRAGTATPFWWGRSISTDQANYNGTTTYGGGPKGPFRKKTEPVDSFAPNPWGLYQVHGNVYTWTEDCWNDSYRGAPANGAAWLSGDCSKRILRGGAYNYFARILRAAFRGPVEAHERNSHFGIRVARTMGP